MVNLDDSDALKKADPAGVLASTMLFPDQCAAAWEESRKIVFPDDYKKVKNIVVCGMGGSRFTPKTIKYLFEKYITLPYEICEDYHLPGYVNCDSLVILSSYSGTTEEVLNCFPQAKEKEAKIAAIMSKKMDVPGYFFDPKFNPCGQPRIGGGYLLMGHLGMLTSLGFVTAPDDVPAAIEFIRTVGKRYAADVPINNNPAKQLAMLLMDKHPFIITAEFLRGFGNGFANQINETAKMISDYRYIPELNHHLLEGLSHPESIHANGLFVFIRSSLYSDRIQKRFTITKDVVEKQHVATEEIALSGTTKLAQALEAFTLSAFTTFYLGMLYGVDPVAIPWVDYFKAQLTKK